MHNSALAMDPGNGDRAENKCQSKNSFGDSLMKLITSASALMALFYAGSAFAQTKPVPEPGVWALMGIGIAAFAARHFTKKR